MHLYDFSLLCDVLFLKDYGRNLATMLIPALTLTLTAHMLINVF